MSGKRVKFLRMAAVLCLVFLITVSVSARDCRDCSKMTADFEVYRDNMQLKGIPVPKSDALPMTASGIGDDSIQLASIIKLHQNAAVSEWLNVDLNKPVIYTNDSDIVFVTPMVSSYSSGGTKDSWYLTLTLGNNPGPSLIWNTISWYRESPDYPPEAWPCFVNDTTGSLIEANATSIIGYWRFNAQCMPPGKSNIKIYHNGREVGSIIINVKEGVDPTYIEPLYNQGKYGRGDAQNPIEDMTWHMDNACRWETSPDTSSHQCAKDGSLKPGEFRVSIARIGCAVSSVCMMLNYYGIPVDPPALNTWLKSQKDRNGKCIGYYETADINWAIIPKYAASRGVNLNFVEKITDNELKGPYGYYLCQYGPQIMHVKNNTHWVLVYGWDDQTDPADPTYLIADPSGGERLTLKEKYGSGTDHGIVRAYRLSNSPNFHNRPRYLIIRLYSPAELFITDAQGRRTGFDPLTGQSYDEIPGASYSIEMLGDAVSGEIDQRTKVLHITDPDPAGYDLKVTGTDEGIYDMSIFGMNNNFTMSNAYYKGIPTAPNYVDTYQVQYDGAIENFEAEEMVLTNYLCAANAWAWNGELVKVIPLPEPLPPDTAPAKGTAAFTYQGVSGSKDLTIWYFDTNDGNATYRLFINGVQKDLWAADQNLGSALDFSTRTSRVFSGIINNGDQIMIEGTADGNELATLDNVEISQSLAVTQLNVVAPGFNPAAGIYDTGQTVIITCPTYGATIRYTIDGSMPNASSPIYDGPISVTETSMIKAYASKSGLSDSTVVTANYKIQAQTPIFNPVRGDYDAPQSIEISCPTSGATIRYTIDGSTPTATSPIYAGPISVSQTTTVKAIATKSGLPDSEIATVTYRLKVAPVMIDPAPGFYDAPQSIILSCSTDGATIRYTTDGSIPNVSSTIYTDPIVVNSNTTIKAFAIKNGLEDSNIATATYEIQ